jgi:hypothetical protein
MTDLKQRLNIELENIEASLLELPASRSCANTSRIELAGIAALLHTFYNGVEKMLRSILKTKNVPLPEGPAWHQNLVTLAVEQNIITQRTAQGLTPYLAFRHFFIHAYIIQLEAERLEPLLLEVDDVFEMVKKDIAEYYL